MNLQRLIFSPNKSRQFFLLDVFRARKIVTKHIETKSIEVGDMLLNSILQSPNGDIAYHYTLDDPTLVFKEGQIVGITFDKVANKQNIVMLTSENASGVVLKGVITRSQYLEAMVPQNFGESTFFILIFSRTKNVTVGKYTVYLNVKHVYLLLFSC